MARRCSFWQLCLDRAILPNREKRRKVLSINFGSHASTYKNGVTRKDTLGWLVKGSIFDQKLASAACSAAATARSKLASRPVRETNVDTQVEEHGLIQQSMCSFGFFRGGCARSEFGCPARALDAYDGGAKAAKVDHMPLPWRKKGWDTLSLPANCIASSVRENFRCTQT